MDDNQIYQKGGDEREVHEYSKQNGTGGINRNQRPDRQQRMRMGSAAKRYGVDIDCICPECFGLLKAEYENNGFTPPDPDKIEVSYLFCPNCGHKKL